jgi:phytoene dehydrogenase-like protein
MTKSIAIIGAGISGLAAGCYAQMNGYQSRIFEMHNLPGGLCTAWERRGYTFDGCLHYLFGSGAGQPFHQVWRELGAIQGRTILNHTEFIRVQGRDDRTFIVYADPDRLEAHMKELSPADAGTIHDFCDAIRQFTRFDMTALQQKPRDQMSPLDWVRLGRKLMPFAPALAKWALLSAQGFADRFRDPFLRQAVPFMFAWPEIPVMAGLSLLAYMHTGNAGFPAGASLDFARAIERRYLTLGGQIHYNSQVERILVEKRRAVGVRLYNDEVHSADLVISAADGHSTIFDLLGGEFVDRGLRQRYAGDLPLYPQIQVSVGVNRDLSGEPHWMTHLLPEPVIIAGQERRDLGVKNYCFDPSLAPAGKSCLVVMMPTTYGFWEHIYGRRLYDTEQQQVADLVIEQLEKLYPGLRQQVEVVDVTTPLSYAHYTGNWQGSSCGWLLTTRTLPMMLLGLGKRLPGLSNFYMVGQWVEPGGSVPLAAMSGRNAMQMICHADRRAFVATVPTGEEVRASQAACDSRVPNPPAPAFWSSKFPGI